MSLDFDRKKKKGLQADWILQKGVESSHGNYVSLFFFPPEFQGKVGSSNYHMLITATHAQKPLGAQSGLPRLRALPSVPWQMEGENDSRVDINGARQRRCCC